MIFDPITKEDDDDSLPKFSMQTKIDLHMEEIDNYVDQEISFFNK